jgi:hypothetical protein
LAYPLLRLALFAASSPVSCDTVGRGSVGVGVGALGNGGIFEVFGLLNNPPTVHFLSNGRKKTADKWTSTCLLFIFLALLNGGHRFRRPENLIFILYQP